MTALGLAVAAAIGNLVGAAAVVRSERRSLRYIDVSLAFGAGFMLSVALAGALPRVIARNPEAGLLVLLGYLAVHLAHHGLAPHLHFGEETHQLSAAAGITASIGLALHTFFDGVAIAAGFLISERLGVLLFLAVFVHKLPEGVTIASIMLAGGQGRRRAFGAAFALGIATVLGVLATGLVRPLATHGLAVAAGVTLYVAASDLVPAFQAKRGWVTPVAFLGGAAAYLLTDHALHTWLG